MIRRWGSYAVVALPPLALTIIGITHPQHLTASAAEYWRNLHIATLPIFPLLGFAPWLLVRPLCIRSLSWAAVVLGFIYGAFYAALDVLAGIGAGGLKMDGMGMATGIGTLYSLANALGPIGAIALICGSTLAAIALCVKVGVSAIPGGLLVILGAVFLYQDHIFFPVGVIGQLFLAVGWTLLLVVSRRRGLRAAAWRPPGIAEQPARPAQ